MLIGRSGYSAKAAVAVSPATMAPTGRAIVAKAHDVVRAYDNIVPSVVHADALQGDVALGAVPTTLTGLVPLAISRLKAGFPDLHVQVTPGLTNPLISRIGRGTLGAAARGFINGLAGFGTALFAFGFFLNVMTPPQAVTIVVVLTVTSAPLLLPAFSGWRHLPLARRPRLCG